MFRNIFNSMFSLVLWKWYSILGLNKLKTKLTGLHVNGLNVWSINSSAEVLIGYLKWEHRAWSFFNITGILGVPISILSYRRVIRIIRMATNQAEKSNDDVGKKYCRYMNINRLHTNFEVYKRVWERSRSGGDAVRGRM